MTTFARRYDPYILPKAWTSELQGVARVKNANTLRFVPSDVFSCHERNPCNRRFNRALYSYSLVQPSLGTRSIFGGRMPKGKKSRGRTVQRTHCFWWYATMDKSQSTLSERQVLKSTIKDQRVRVRGDVDDWMKFICDERDLLEEMHFQRFRDDHPYVLIVPGDVFPCEAGSWCQIACGVANHIQKARTLLYDWTLDLALVSEHKTDLVRVLFGESLKKDTPNF